MLKSMTGFGRCEEVIEGFSVQVQIKSVNHRYSDITVKTPRRYSFLEEPLRSLAVNSIARGKVEVLLNLEKEESGDTSIALDKSVAEGYLNALRELSKYGLKDDLTISSMIGLHDIFSVKQEQLDEKQLLRIVSDVYKRAHAEFVTMRKEEGARLEENLRQHLDALLNEVSQIEGKSPASVEAYRERLRNRIREVLEDKQIDEGRILTEAAIFADKVAVDEETVRLKSHVKAFVAAMDTDQPIGKKLDFIVQEMNRESNTIGSKCNDIAVAGHVVELKSIIEKIREQIQNIE